MDHAVDRRDAKRGGSAQILLDRELIGARTRERAVVELRFFGGLSVEKTAEVLRMSLSLRELSCARRDGAGA